MVTTVPQTQRQKWFVAVAVAMGALIEIVDASVVNVALSHIQASYGATLTQVSWVVSGYSIANVIVLPLAAWIGQRIGKKRYFALSLVGFTLASLLCGMAGSLTALVIARILQGLTGGGLIAKAQAILYETFAPEEHPMAQAFFGAIVVAGPAIGPTLGGSIATHLDWRWIFLINLPIGCVALLLVLLALPADTLSSHRQVRVDLVSILLLATGLGSVQYVLEEGQSAEWFASSHIASIAFVGLGGIIAFVWRVLESQDPIVDLRVLRHRSLWVGSILSLVVGVALYGSLFVLPVFSQAVMQYTPEQTGLMLLPGAVVTALCMPLIGWLNRRVGPVVMLPIGCCLLILAVLDMSHLNVNTSSEGLFWSLILRAVGTSMVFMPLNLATLGSIPKQDLPAATGFFNLTRQLGGSIGVALLATIISNRQAVHRGVLVESLNPARRVAADHLAQVTERFASQGEPLARAYQSALAVLDGLVERQALIRAFDDAFLVTLLIVLLALPLLLLLGKPRPLGQARPRWSRS